MVTTRQSPTFGLLAGLAVTLSAVAVYSAYTVAELRSLRRLQAETIDRNRADSLLLLRIQNNLNSLALTMRDMLDQSLDVGESYPLLAWKGQLRRVKVDLSDAMEREEKVSRATEDQRKYLAGSVAQFWDALDRIFAMADQGAEAEARTRIRLSLQARQEALSNAVARLLVQNNEREQEAAAEAQHIYSKAEKNAYLFLAAMLVLIVATSLYLVAWNRAMFAQVAALSERRSELARQLILIQENTFRHISRELHDEFGQILTAIGAMLARAGKRIPPLDDGLRADFLEIREIVQSTLDKIRALSQALHPVVLDDAGLEGAFHLYLPKFERQTGIAVHYEKDGESRLVDHDVAIHVYRVLQEALTNVARHSKSAEADVRLRFRPRELVLEIEDHGVGFGQLNGGKGMGLTSMRERAELVHGTIEFSKQNEGGALVRLTVPLIDGGS
jgi:signal transduction histidine kinase